MHVASRRNPHSGVARTTLTAHRGPVTCLAVSQNSRLVASGSADETLCLYNAATGTLQHVLAGHEGAVLCVAFAPSSQALLSGSADYTAIM